MEPTHTDDDLFRIAMMLESFAIHTGLENAATEAVTLTLEWVMREISDQEFFDRYEAIHETISKGAR